jgi:hypothetical protein
LYFFAIVVLQEVPNRTNLVENIVERKERLHDLLA